MNWSFGKIVGIFVLVVAGTFLLEVQRLGTNKEESKTKEELSQSVVVANYESSPDLPAGLLEGTEELAITSTNTPSVTPTPSPTKTTTTLKVTPKVTTTPRPTSTPVPTTPVPTIDYSRPWTVAPNCPSTTQACVPCTSGTYCRFEPGKSHGFLGWSCQNNNPGNIRNASTNMATDFKNLMIVRNGGTAACGVRYDSRGGSYFVFSTYTAGYGALKAYVKGINNGEHSAYVGCGNCSITYFFSKYAPGDPNYDDYVASYIGVPPTQTIKYVIDNGKLDGFVEAIKIHEGFFVQ